jgi:hypothetical protein
MNRKCLRCDTEGCSLLSGSPIAGKWELYRCNRCRFVWRNTEESYLAPHVLKLTEDEMHLLPHI